jgi:hypothetical protein
MHEAMFSMFFFWLGTVPSMVVAPGIFQHLIRPLKSKLPKTFAISLMLIGVMTITFRITKIHDPKASNQPAEVKHEMSCH